MYYIHQDITDSFLDDQTATRMIIIIQRKGPVRRAALTVILQEIVPCRTAVLVLETGVELLTLTVLDLLSVRKLSNSTPVSNKNSPGDEIVNVNFLLRHRTYRDQRQYPH